VAGATLKKSSVSYKSVILTLKIYIVPEKGAYFYDAVNFPTKKTE